MFIEPCDRDGYKTFRFPAQGEIPGKTLWGMKAYINSLNAEACANLNINKYGALALLGKWQSTIVKTASDKFGIVLGDEFSPLIFRGENKYHKDFRSSALRYSDVPKGEERIKHCIDTVKKWEFLDIFKRSPYYTRCRKFKVLDCKFDFDLEAVAQHFGFMSKYIDISKNFLVALFFAYTYQENGIYKPINDFEGYSPTLYVGNLKEIYDNNPDQLKLIGFQAMLRPLMQQAMAIEVSQDDNVKSLFRKIDLPKEKVLANQIYAFHSYGDSLFPPDFFGATSFNIRKNKLLYRKFFDKYCRENDLNAEDFLNELKREGYSLKDKKYDISKFSRYMMNRSIDDSILPFLWRVRCKICDK